VKPKLIIILTVLTVSLCGCKKNLDSDLLGTGEFTGIAYAVRLLESRVDTIVLKNKSIFLKAGPTDNNYLYQTKTDEEGRFRFTNLKTQAYSITATDTIDGVPYAGILSSNSGTFLYLLPDTKNINYVLLNLYDTLLPPTPINKATVYRFTNKIFYDSSFLPGVVDSLQTDANGRVKYSNLLPGTVYLIGKIVLDSTTTLFARKQLVIPKTGIVNDSMVLRKR
jgi:hypothetical protein